MNEVLSLFGQGWSETKSLLVVCMVGLVIERFRPFDQRQPINDVAFNIVQSAILILATTFLYAWTMPYIRPLYTAYGGPIIEFTFPDNRWGEFGYAVTFFFIFDFFYYWFHRFQHTWSVFWQQHKLHHSEESLNVTTTMRHHWLEDWLRIFIVILPMSWLFKLHHGQVGLIWAAVLLWGYFIHLNLNLRLGWLSYVISGPVYHRIHHSSLPQHQDKNFAAFFPIWDIIFGSAYFPKKEEEAPPTGLSSGERITNHWQANVGPFKAWFSMLKPKKKLPQE